MWSGQRKASAKATWVCILSLDRSFPADPDSGLGCWGCLMTPQVADCPVASPVHTASACCPFSRGQLWEVPALPGPGRLEAGERAFCLRMSLSGAQAWTTSGWVCLCWLCQRGQGLPWGQLFMGWGQGRGRCSWQRASVLAWQTHEGQVGLWLSLSRCVTQAGIPSVPSPHASSEKGDGKSHLFLTGHCMKWQLVILTLVFRPWSEEED